MRKFEFIEHTADIKFRAFGKTIEKVFENSALALKESIYSGKTRKKILKKIKANGKDYESLLYNFLEEFLILFDSEKFILSKVKKIKIDNFELYAEILGDSSEKYKIENHIKAITYNEMFIKKIKNKFVAQVVLDI